MKSELLFEEGGHRWMVIGRDPKKRDEVIDTNEYAIVTSGGTMLLDPGGVEVFPRVLSELTRHISTADITTLFASHQDPDIISSLPMWLDLCPGVETYVSWMWKGFISHFSMGRDLNLIGVPDEGMEIKIGRGEASVQQRYLLTFATRAEISLSSTDGPRSCSAEISALPYTRKERRQIFLFEILHDTFSIWRRFICVGCLHRWPYATGRNGFESSIPR